MVPVCPHSDVPQGILAVAGCSQGCCGISALGCCTWGRGATSATWPASPSQRQCPRHRAILPAPAPAPRPPHTGRGALPKGNAIASPPLADELISNKHRQTPPPKISQAVISRNSGKAVSRQAAALGGCWIEWHFPPRLSRGSLEMIKGCFFSFLGLFFYPRTSLVPDEAFPRLVPPHPQRNLPLLTPSIPLLLLSWG